MGCNNCKSYLKQNDKNSDLVKLFDKTNKISRRKKRKSKTGNMFDTPDGDKFDPDMALKYHLHDKNMS